MTKTYNHISGNEIETLQSNLWPEISAKIWRVGNAWFCKCQSENFPQMAKMQNFASREQALEHAKVVLAL